MDFIDPVLCPQAVYLSRARSSSPNVCSGHRAIFTEDERASRGGVQVVSVADFDALNVGYNSFVHGYLHSPATILLGATSPYGINPDEQKPGLDHFTKDAWGNLLGERFSWGWTEAATKQNSNKKGRAVSALPQDAEH